MSAVDQYGDFQQNIGNYKGLMLCNRPNEEIRIEVEKPFISRVDPKDSLGLNPIYHPQKNKPIKSNQKVLDVLSRHKQWLNQFKQRVRYQKSIKQNEQGKESQQIQRLRHQSLNRIEQEKIANGLLKLGDQDIAPEVSPDQLQSILNDSYENDQQNYDQNYYNDQGDNYEGNQEQGNNNAINNKQQKLSGNKKKNNKQKPEWAYTEEQLKQKNEDEEEEEVDELLDFVSGLDYKKYIDDFDVKNMVSQLKDKIDQLVQNKNEMPSQQQQHQRNQSQNYDNEDMRSQKSYQSKSSIGSIRDEVAKKYNVKDKKDWDKSTECGEDKNKITVQQRLAKHIADEILKQNKYLRNIHSNSSLRVLLENEAQAQIQKQTNQN